MSLIFFLKPHYRHHLAPEWPIRAKPKRKKRRIYAIDPTERRPTVKEIDYKEFAVEIHALAKKAREERYAEDEILTLLQMMMELDNG